MTTPSTPSKFNPSRLVRTTVPMGLVALAAAAYWLPSQSQTDTKKPPPAPLPVTTVQVKAEDVPVSQIGIGNVQPMASVTVRTRVDGQLESVGFKEGQDVRAGQPLARIDPRVFQAQLAQAEAQKARNQVLLGNAQTDLARYTQLIKEEATTQQVLDNARALVAQLQATLKTDEALVSLAQVQLSFTSINSPISGRAGARLVDPGNIVRATDATGLVVINQIDPINVQFTLPEAGFQTVNQAMRGARKPLRVEALDRQTRQVLAVGELVLLNNQIDPATGTVVLKARFANPGHKLWPGQSVNARIILGERSQAMTVPLPVVQRGQNGLFAYVVEANAEKGGDVVRIQPIQVLQQSDGRAVVGGLKAGDRVVADGQYRLTPGARVTEAKAGAGKPAGGASAATPTALAASDATSGTMSGTTSGAPSSATSGVKP